MGTPSARPRTRPPGSSLSLSLSLGWSRFRNSELGLKWAAPKFPQLRLSLPPLALTLSLAETRSSFFLLLPHAREPQLDLSPETRSSPWSNSPEAQPVVSSGSAHVQQPSGSHQAAAQQPPSGSHQAAAQLTAAALFGPASLFGPIQPSPPPPDLGSSRPGPAHPAF
ncbi:hypothetical protein CDL15_Pgr016061 [Punica granatum]|uniref:Uncharacterized protein n=1 Tax=Punica granatum TaxID=22663 RepID=A0A218XQ20_PUNGR|nr:hypothetical protein CDL15_Pgr016061 [Punica granatum]